MAPSRRRGTDLEPDLEILEDPARMAPRFGYSAAFSPHEQYPPTAEIEKTAPPDRVTRNRDELPEHLMSSECF